MDEQAEEEPERERTLADVLVWRRGEWRGPSPREHLLDWSLRNGVRMNENVKLPVYHICPYFIKSYL